MSKCPFWSNKKVVVACNNECPMNPADDGEECIFKTCLSGIVYKEINNIIGYDDDYQQDYEEDYFIKNLKYKTGY